jgi:hypothetical protein
MERRMRGGEVGKARFGRVIEKLDRLRQQQNRLRREQHAVGERDDGADRTRIGRWLVATVIGRSLWLRGPGCRIRCGEVRGGGEVGLRQRGLERRRRLRCNGMEMAERQHKLQDERRQRQPRAEFKVFSKPIHAALRGPLRHPAVPNVTLCHGRQIATSTLRFDEVAASRYSNRPVGKGSNLARSGSQSSGRHFS